MAENNRTGKKSNILSWLLYTVLVSIPTIWFTVIVPYFGGILKLTKIVGEQVQFTVRGVISTIIVTVILLVIMYYKSKFQVKSQISELEDEVSYLRSITDNVDRICDEKYIQLQRSIVEIKENGVNPPKIISNPNHQLKSILTAITSCIVELMKTPDLNFAFKDFYVTLTYNFPLENDEWSWTDGITEKYMSLDELLSDSVKSTFNYLRKSKKPYYFNNKKEDAKREDRYVFNPQDELNFESGEPAGSIFCYNYKIKKGSKVFIDAMLSISTQKKRFAPENDEQIKNARDNLVSLSKDYFGKRISIELSLLYLEYLKENDKDLCTPNKIIFSSGYSSVTSGDIYFDAIGQK